ncbi:AAA family ATPase [Tsukamurella hominis]|uniref:AAA family ATPase n=1 Tax=Tsukamurella hominis TaxID=1970232 RepID=UPI0039ECC4CC
MHKPLYSVDAGVLLQDGINGVHSQVAHVFERCRRWDAVLLLDEVDVIVGRRDHNIDRNTLTAAFLRVMETFDRLTFMTTNRLDDVDDAVLSRCTALLNYAPPTGDQARKVWEILAELHGRTLDAELLDQLLAAYPAISPRDVRQMLRLAVQTAGHDRVPLTLDVFTDVAQFRGIATTTGVSGDRQPAQ